MCKNQLLNVIIMLVLSVVINSCNKTETRDERELLDHDMRNLSIGDTIAPFRYVNSSNDDWRVVIRISGEDLFDVSHHLNTRMFYSTEDKVLERIRQWKFIYRRGGVRDASSTLRVFKDDKLEQTYGLIIEKNLVGIQSKEAGLLEAVNSLELLEIIKLMD